MLLVGIVAGVAIAAKDQFAYVVPFVCPFTHIRSYVGAIVGSIGSSLLSYVLPSLIQNQLEVTCLVTQSHTDTTFSLIFLQWSDVGTMLSVHLEWLEE